MKLPSESTGSNVMSLPSISWMAAGGNLGPTTMPYFALRLSRWEAIHAALGSLTARPPPLDLASTIAWTGAVILTSVSPPLNPLSSTTKPRECLGDELLKFLVPVARFARGDELVSEVPNRTLILRFVSILDGIDPFADAGEFGDGVLY